MRNWRALPHDYFDWSPPYCDVCGKTLMGVPWARPHACDACKKAIEDAKTMTPKRKLTPPASPGSGTAR